MKSGNLKIKLNGDILKGEFALVKLNNDEDNSWLLIKHRDEYAVDDFNSEDLVPDQIKAMKNNKEGTARALPSAKKIKAEKKSPRQTVDVDEPAEEAATGKPYKPMMAKLESKVFDDEDWIYERKLDGYRAIGYTGPKPRLISRNDIDFSRDYQKITDALKKIPKKAILDGELVIEDEHGKSSFQNIQNYKGETRGLNLKYYVFGLLNLDGHDLRGMELIKRKQLLKTFLSSAGLPDIVYNEHVTGKGASLFEKAKKRDGKG